MNSYMIKKAIKELDQEYWEYTGVYEVVKDWAVIDLMYDLGVYKKYLRSNCGLEEWK